MVSPFANEPVRQLLQTKYVEGVVDFTLDVSASLTISTKNLLGNLPSKFLCILRTKRAKYTSCAAKGRTSCHRKRWYKCIMFTLFAKHDVPRFTRHYVSPEVTLCIGLRRHYVLASQSLCVTCGDVRCLPMESINDNESNTFLSNDNSLRSKDNSFGLLSQMITSLRQTSFEFFTRNNLFFLPPLKRLSSSRF